MSVSYGDDVLVDDVTPGRVVGVHGDGTVSVKVIGPEVQRLTKDRVSRDPQAMRLETFGRDRGHLDDARVALADLYANP